MVLLGWYETRRCVLVDLPPEQAIEQRRRVLRGTAAAGLGTAGHRSRPVRLCACTATCGARTIATAVAAARPCARVAPATCAIVRTCGYESFPRTRSGHHRAGARRRCGAAGPHRRAGSQVATPPSPGSSNPANRSKTRCAARCTRKPASHPRGSPTTPRSPGRFPPR